MNTETMETYEQKRDREIVERLETIKKTETKFREVFKLLGLKVIEPNEPNTHSSHLAGKNGDTEIFLSSRHYGSEGKINVSGNYPRDSRGQYCATSYSGDPSAPSINVSLDKTAEQIAKDIQRRFMPDYLVKLASVLERVKNSNNYENSSVSALEFVKGEKLDNYEITHKEITRINIKDGYGSIKAFGTSLTLEVNGITKETARKIVELLA